jgi:ribonuclease P protein component
MPFATIKHTFKKEERLCKRTDIEFLLKKGQSFNKFPLKAIYLTHTPALKPPMRIAISVPKRKVKNAVDRNRIKRLIREAFRLQKHTLTTVLTDKNSSLDMLLVFSGNLNITFTVIQDKIILILQRLKQAHEQITEQGPDSNDKVL